MIDMLNVVDGDSINILKGLRGATLRRMFGSAWILISGAPT